VTWTTPKGDHVRRSPDCELDRCLDPLPSAFVEPPSEPLGLGHDADASSSSAWVSRGRLQEEARSHARQARAHALLLSQSRLEVVNVMTSALPHLHTGLAQASAREPTPGVPIWCNDIEPGHSCKLVGGWVICEKCGGTSSMGGARGLLHKPCRGFPVKGSMGRTKTLLSGKLPKADGPLWPDGRSDPVRRVYSLLRAGGFWEVAGAV